jgi:23S rRNA (uracil1939-C5)-methyltransferase
MAEHERMVSSNSRLKGAEVYRTGGTSDQRNASAATTEVAITALGGRGDGIGRLTSGEVVLVRDGVPGDRVAVTLQRLAGRLHGRIIALVDASPQRERPSCPVATACGGCSWQHVARETQENAKRDLCRRALGTDTFAWIAPVPAFAHRRRVRLHFRRDGDTLRAGFLERERDTLCATNACQVLVPALDGLIARATAALQPRIERGELMATDGAEGCVAEVHARPLPDAAPLDADGARQLAATLGLCGLDLHLGRHSARWGRTDVTLRETVLPLVPHGCTLPIAASAAGFSQATEAGNAAIRQAVCAELDAIGPLDAAFEAFAGSGNLSVLLVGRVRHLTTVELDRDAVARARRALTSASDLGTDVTVACGYAGASARAATNADLWLFDPGRPGAREVCEAALNRQPRHLIYVSCAPDTFLRDRKILELGSYRVISATAIDALPHTPHVELVARFVRTP